MEYRKLQDNVRTLQVFSSETVGEVKKFTSARKRDSSKSQKKRKRRKKRVKEKIENRNISTKENKERLKNEIFVNICRLKQILRSDGSEIDKLTFIRVKDPGICTKDHWKKIHRQKVLNEIFYPQFDVSKRSEEEINLRRTLYKLFNEYYNLFGKRKIDTQSESKFRYEEVAPDHSMSLVDILMTDDGPPRSVKRKQKEERIERRKQRKQKKSPHQTRREVEEEDEYDDVEDSRYKMYQQQQRYKQDNHWSGKKVTFKKKKRKRDEEVTDPNPQPHKKQKL